MGLLFVYSRNGSTWIFKGFWVNDSWWDFTAEAEIIIDQSMHNAQGHTNYYCAELDNCERLLMLKGDPVV